MNEFFFSVLRRLSTGLILFALGDPFMIFVLCRCYHATGFPVLIPSVAALGLLLFQKNYLCVKLLWLALVLYRTHLNFFLKKKTKTKEAEYN